MMTYQLTDGALHAPKQLKGKVISNKHHVAGAATKVAPVYNLPTQAMGPGCNSVCVSAMLEGGGGVVV